MFLINPYIYSPSVFNWPFTSSNWTTVTGTPTWTGTQVTFPWASTVKIKENDTYNSNIVYCQTDLTWTTDSTSEDIAGMALTSNSSLLSAAYTTTYSAKITTRNDTGGKFRLFAWAGTYNSYGDSALSVTKNKSVKITFDTSNNNIKFWYWSWSAWTQMWTTQTYDIKNGWTLYFHLWYDIIVTSIWVTTFDNTYFGSVATDYSTHYPV